jgi:glyoxylase-like metal-dependent hydrolase (beta-lactamase superfamily II)
MNVTEICEDLFLVDLETGGFEGIAAAYILKGAKSIIVETGPTSSVGNLFSSLLGLGIQPDDVAYVAVSHVHVDHAGGVGTLLKSLPNAKVIVHPNGLKHMIDPERLWKQTKLVLGKVADVYGAPEPVPEDRLVGAANSMIFDVGKNTKLKVVETLGHAAHHLSFYSQRHNGIFTGDAAGIYLSKVDAVIPTTPPPFRLEMTLTSLEKLDHFKPKRLFYSHFGVADKAENRLRLYADQLRLWMKIAQEGVAKGDTVEKITNRIFEEDRTMTRIVAYVEANEILMKAGVGNSIQGLIESAKEVCT